MTWPCVRMVYYPDDPEPDDDEPWTPYDERALADDKHCVACLRPQLFTCELRRSEGAPSAGFNLCGLHAAILQGSDWSTTCREL